MTSTATSIEIAADPQAIFRLASATQRWPELLPHYRRVRVLETRGATRVVEMAAKRDWIPISWVAEQTDDPARPHIGFRHIRGWTRGMEVEWIFEPSGTSTRVTIAHRLQFRFPFAAEWLGEHVVAGFFIDYVARRAWRRSRACRGPCVSAHRVVVTGMGVLSPIGHGIDTFWEATLAGKVGIRAITRFDSQGYRSRIAGEIASFDPADYMSHKADPAGSDDRAVCGEAIARTHERANYPGQISTESGVWVDSA